MPTWRDERRACPCGETFNPKRESETYCTKRCANAATQRRERSGDISQTLITVARSGDTPATPNPEAFSDRSTVVWPTKDEQHGPTPGALQGDDVTLEYYEDGFPKLPACLDRRKVQLSAKAA